ncbi:MAG: NfeD family protein [Ruminococcaceae bacterium]|nr:NfeD family protein [Oscillospiraceae bacterium]HHV31093.1 NfeD family protein [Clostridiales bacterium]
MEAFMPYIWLAVIVAAAIIEGSTAQLVSIWFVIGGLGALIAQLCGAELWLQTVIFAVITLLTLLATRPLVKKLLRVKHVDTNVGRYIGKVGIVTAEINNQLGTGQVNVMGSIWTARSTDNSIVPVGCSVQVKEIEGVKLMVVPMRQGISNE